MGIFDDIEVLYPLPNLPADHNKQFQTKSLRNFLLHYRIDEEGLLWREDFDVEKGPTIEGEGIFKGLSTFKQVNQRWVRDNYTGEISFHNWLKDEERMLKYKAWFKDGQLHDLVEIPDG